VRPGRLAILQAAVRGELHRVEHAGEFVGVDGSRHDSRSVCRAVNEGLLRQVGDRSERGQIMRVAIARGGEAAVQREAACRGRGCQP
jgi:hypothetical protein